MEFDYLVIGGGICGVVLASRLSQKNPAASIALIEAGRVPDSSVDYGSFQALLGSEYDWKYSSEPQNHLNDRKCDLPAGKGLGGGSIINASGWIRGDSLDYDDWASAVKDERWGYAGMLPYLKRVEKHENAEADIDVHGTDGPVNIESVTYTGRKYPLRELIKNAYVSAGFSETPDLNGGSPAGIAELVENRTDGKRTLAQAAYSLSGMQLLTESLVSRVLIEVSSESNKKLAVGVELADGRQLRAKIEIIVCCGAYRTPQLLMLSGLGPSRELEKHEIPQVSDLPVGENLHDHLAVSQWWKLRHPERGLALGSPLLTDPLLLKGNPVDWTLVQTISQDEIEKAVGRHNAGNAAAPADNRCYLESLVVYGGANATDPHIPFDGTHLTSTVALMLPTSRGTVRIRSRSPQDPPVVDHQYYATETDRYVLRKGIKTMAQILLRTPEGQELVEEETIGSQQHKITPESPDEHIDILIKRNAQTFYHPAGSASMGRVVDTNLRVYGVENLRVCDASVVPVPICSHYQALMYALGERCADLVTEGD